MNEKCYLLYHLTKDVAAIKPLMPPQLVNPEGTQFSSVHLLSHVHLSATPWTAARQASLSFTISQSLLKFMSIESVMPSICRPLLLLPSIFLSIRVFSSESALRIRWPKYWSFSFSINLSNEYSMERTDFL